MLSKCDELGSNKRPEPTIISSWPEFVITCAISLGTVSIIIAEREFEN